MILNREQILAIDDSNIESIEISEWSGSVNVRRITAGEREHWEQVSLLSKDKNLSRATLVALACCDSEGKTLFSTADVSALNTKCFSAIDKIFNHVMKLNLITQKDVDDSVKN